MWWWKKRDRPVTTDRPLVFVSYCRNDYDCVLQLRNALSSYRIASWIDSTIVGGEQWEREIRKAIDASTFYLLCLSQALDARKETYVAKELNMIFEKDRHQNSDSGRVLPVLLNCDRSPRIAGFNYHDELSRIQHISLAQNWSAGVGKLLSSIDPFLGLGPLASNPLNTGMHRFNRTRTNNSVETVSS